MSAAKPLDLSGLHSFRASELLARQPTAGGPVAPMQIALALIDFDPQQPRRSFREDTLEELSESIRIHGVLEPISVRVNPVAAGRFLVNRGERRVRAALRAGLSSVPAFADERADPFVQAVENLHREDMSPLDLARFIGERETQGLSRAEIARRLAKPRSFVTEAAALIDMPSVLKEAVEQERIGLDVRSLYRLVTAWRREPEAVATAFERDMPANRSEVEQMLAQQGSSPSTAVQKKSAAPVRSSAVPSGGRTVLVVEHEGRRGSLRIKAHDGDKAQVQFADGSYEVLPLRELRLVCWAVQEQ